MISGSLDIFRFILRSFKLVETYIEKYLWLKKNFPEFLTLATRTLELLNCETPNNYHTSRTNTKS